MAVNDLIHELKSHGAGSLLRGWRRVLDPDGSMCCSFQAFCKAAADVGFHGDVSSLFHFDRQQPNLTFAELAPAQNAFLEGFREWVKGKFVSPGDMIDTFRSSGDAEGTVDCDRFISACVQHGFDADEEDLRELFDGIDLDNSGALTKAEVIFLESDSALREMEMFQEKQRRGADEAELLLKVFLEGKWQKQNLSPSHRLAQRPWQEIYFESLPRLVLEKRCASQRAWQKTVQEAKELFQKHMQSIYGNEVRAWRRGLDPQATFKLSEQDLRWYCRRIEFPGHSHALWVALDSDRDGTLAFEELCVQAADLLASFRKWIRDSFGRCVDFWDSSALKKEKGQGGHIGSRSSDKKMFYQEVRAALSKMECPQARTKDHVQRLLRSLDLYGCGFWARGDMEWLDAWCPADWLSAEPDIRAWHEIRLLLLKKYDHMLKAWRSLLDVDNSNRASWSEFKKACDHVHFSGNVGGAWRSLDQSLSGWISLRQIDPPSAELLGSFKTWADQQFGSVKLAFKAIDADGGGTLSYSEVRRACRKYNWVGDVRLLFDCLDDGSRNIELSEIAFLDNWELDVEEPSRTDNVLDTDGAEKIRRCHRSVALLDRLPELAKPYNPRQKPVIRTKALDRSMNVLERRQKENDAAKKTLCRTFRCRALAYSSAASNNHSAAVDPSPWLERLWQVSPRFDSRTQVMIPSAGACAGKFHFPEIVGGGIATLGAAQARSIVDSESVPRILDTGSSKLGKHNAKSVISSSAPSLGKVESEVDAKPGEALRTIRNQLTIFKAKEQEDYMALQFKLERSRPKLQDSVKRKVVSLPRLEGCSVSTTAE